MLIHKAILFLQPVQQTIFVINFGTNQKQVPREAYIENIINTQVINKKSDPKFDDSFGKNTRCPLKTLDVRYMSCVSYILSQLQSYTYKLKTCKLGFSNKIHEFNQKILILQVLIYDHHILYHSCPYEFFCIVLYMPQIFKTTFNFIPTLKMQKICMS